MIAIASSCPDCFRLEPLQLAQQAVGAMRWMAISPIKLHSVSMPHLELALEQGTALMCSDETIHEWIKEYECDHELFQSRHVFHQLKLEQLEVFTTHMGRPNIIETAVCMAILAQVAQEQTHTQRILAHIHRALEYAIYGHAVNLAPQVSFTQWIETYYRLEPFFLALQHLQHQHEKFQHESSRQYILEVRICSYDSTILTSVDSNA